MPVLMALAGGWRSVARDALMLRCSLLYVVALDPNVVLSARVSLHESTCVVSDVSPSGYQHAAEISINPCSYAYDNQADGCPNLVVLDERTVVLALALVDVDLRLAFTTAADCGVFTEWFVRSARAAQEARREQDLLPATGLRRTRRKVT